MPIDPLNDHIVVNQGGTPGVAGSGTYAVSSTGHLFEQALTQAASADPTTLTAFEGAVIWWGGQAYLWDGAQYLLGGRNDHTSGPTAPASANIGDTWFNTTEGQLYTYTNDGTVDLWVAIGEAVHTAGPSAPTSPKIGDTWWDTINSELNLYFWNGTANVWGAILKGSGLPADALGVLKNDGLGNFSWAGGLVLTGTGAPAAGVGADGDFYVDTATGEFYGPKAAGVWPAAPTLIPPGAQPFDWQSYAGDPTGVVTARSDATALVDGDMCWDTTNDVLYIWDGAAWSNPAASASAAPTLYAIGSYAELAFRNTTGSNANTALGQIRSGLIASIINASMAQYNIFAPPVPGSWMCVGPAIATSTVNELAVAMWVRVA